MKAFLIILAALLLFGALFYSQQYLRSKAGASAFKSGSVADIRLLQETLRKDSLYQVRAVQYRDSGILIAVDNPDPTGTEVYFNNKYRLNSYSNINMVYIFQYDSALSLSTVSLEDALMATGKRMGRFQQEWTARFIDTADKSCMPLKRYIQLREPVPSSYRNEETVFQPASIFKMQVVCRYRAKDSSGAESLKTVTALVDTSGHIVSVN